MSSPSLSNSQDIHPEDLLLQIKDNLDVSGVENENNLENHKDGTIYNYQGQKYKYSVIMEKMPTDKAVNFIIDDVIFKNFSQLNLKYINREKIKEDLLPLAKRFISDKNCRKNIAQEIITRIMAQNSNIDEEVSFLMETIPEIDKLVDEEKLDIYYIVAVHANGLRSTETHVLAATSLTIFGVREMCAKIVFLGGDGGGGGNISRVFVNKGKIDTLDSEFLLNEEKCIMCLSSKGEWLIDNTDE